MHDRGLFWSPVPDWSQASIWNTAVSVTVAAPHAAYLLSGAIDRFLEPRRLPCIGPRARCGSASYALRLAPDRVLGVFGDAEAAGPPADGWDDGLAVSDVSDGLVVLDVTGPAALELMSMGAAYDFTAQPDHPLESAFMLFAGVKVAVARTSEGWRLHVERPFAAALWHWLQRVASQVDTRQVLS